MYCSDNAKVLFRYAYHCSDNEQKSFLIDYSQDHLCVVINGSKMEITKERKTVLLKVGRCDNNKNTPNAIGIVQLRNTSYF